MRVSLIVLVKLLSVIPLAVQVSHDNHDPHDQEDSVVRYQNVIPRTIFESDPPNEMCTYGFIGGLEKTMNANPGSSITILSQITLENILRWTGLIPGRVTLSPKETAHMSHGPPVNASIRPKFDPSPDTQSASGMAGLEDIQESISSFGSAIRSENLTLSGLAASADVEGQADAQDRSIVSANVAAPWRSLVNSYFVEALMKGLIGKVTPSGLGFSVDSPMLNLGDVICQASEWARKGDTDWHTYACTAVTAVGEAVGCANTAGPNCVAEILLHNNTPRATTCETLHTGVVEIQLTGYEAGGTVSDEEGLITYYLFRAIWDFQQFASRGGLCGMRYATHDLVPGWNSVLEISVAEPGVRALRETNNTVIKTALMLAKSEDEYLILVRGTSNDYEWNKNFRTQLITLGDGYGNVHSGVYELSRSILPEVVKVLKTRASVQTKDKIKVTVTGHSLGGGIANVLGLLLVQESQQNLNNQLDIQVIGLAAPRTLDKAGTEVLRQGANVRNWLAELDVVPELPCARSIGFPRCDSRTAFGAHGEGADFYADQLNPVMIRTSDLTKLDTRFGTDTWGSLKIDFALTGGIKLNTSKFHIPAPLQIPAYHLCAYACYLSTTYCLSEEQKLSDSGWMCSDCPWIEI